MHLVHALEAAEEPLDRAKPSAENEIERKRRGSRIREQDSEARQGRVPAVEALVEGNGERPQAERRDAEADENERAAQADEPVRREANVRPPFLDNARFAICRLAERRDVSSR
jgi:hypothetical protein